jgi:putative mRNA 3-end processing factor
VNEVVESHLEVEFAVDPYTSDVDLGPEDALVLPMTTARINWVDQLASETGAVKAGFSGLAVDDAFRFRGDYDVTFPLSDHCDFTELRELVGAVDPDRVYTQHGSAAVFARTLTRKGYEATALRENQTSLGDF